MKGESSYNPLNEIHLIVFAWVRFPNSIEQNQTDWVRLSSICSIEFDLFGNRTHWKCGVRFRSIEFDWVRFSNVRFTMPGVKFPKAVKTSVPLPKVFTKVCTYFDVTNLSLFYWWVNKISYPWDFASAPPCACICNYLRRDDETFCVESGYIYFSSL